jgi:hypothetical protein
LGEQNLRFAFDPGSYLTIVNTCLTDSLGYQASGGNQRVSTGSVIGLDMLEKFEVTVRHKERWIQFKLL